MNDITNKPKDHDPSLLKAQAEMNQKLRQEEDQKKRVQGHADPVKAASQTQAQTPMTHNDNKIADSHKEASRTHDAGRDFQKFSQTQPASAPPPSVEAQKVASNPDHMKAAELHRQRFPNVKA